MASLLSCSILLLLVFSSTIQLSIAIRTTALAQKVTPKKNVHVTVPSDKKQTDCEEEGTVSIPGIGRYDISTGTLPVPDLTNWDHSVPAAMNGHYLPGVDDNIIPNPGFEIPNPFHGSNP